MAKDDLSELRLLRLSELLKLIPLSRATLYRRMAEGTFPKALKIGERSIAWRYNRYCYLYRQCATLLIGVFLLIFSIPQAGVIYNPTYHSINPFFVRISHLGA